VDPVPMEARLHVEMLPQPDPLTCGPTALHAVYRYYGDDIPLDQVVSQIPMLESGGTLAPVLACHALRRGYRAIIYTYDLQLFDPTWFPPVRGDIRERLTAQMRVKTDPKVQITSCAYLDFLGLGGELRYEDLTSSLMRKYLVRSMPIITGLSATYLYGSEREFGKHSDYDDVRGEPAGHFVVLCGYHRENRTVFVADPIQVNPAGKGPHYEVGINRVLCAILLGVLTYDGNLLILTPREERKGTDHVHPHRR
jgi:hypothetical protein